MKTLSFLGLAFFVLSLVPGWGSEKDDTIETIIAPATAESPRNSEGDIIVLEDGSLLAAWSEFYGGSRDDSAARISAKRSVDGGRTWGERFTLRENTGAENVMSASFLRLDSGELLLFYLEKHSREDLDVLVVRSGDDGKTWSEPVLVTPEPGYHVMNNARVLLTSGGRLVCPVATTDRVWEKGHRFRTICYLSDDGGHTWRRGTGEVNAPKRGAMEPGLIEKADGTLLQVIRTQTGRQWFAESKDGGDTWSEGRPWTVTSPEAPATLANLPEGKGWLVIHNPSLDPENSHGGERTPLVASVSTDEGATWSPAKAIESDPALTYSYVSVDFHADRVLLTYYLRSAPDRLSWKFQSLPLGWFLTEE